ncbi:MAG: sigma factor [bacterium]
MPEEIAEFKILYEKYGAVIYRRCLRFLKSEQDAQDASQEIFIK